MSILMNSEFMQLALQLLINAHGSKTNDQTDIILEYLTEELTRLSSVVNQFINERKEAAKGGFSFRVAVLVAVVGVFDG